MQKTAPFKSGAGNLITDTNIQMERRIEYYADLCKKDNRISDEGMNSVDILPVLGEMDNAPTLEEVLQAIEKMPNKKGPGIDGILADIFKCGKNILSKQLHSLLRCSETGPLPQDLQDSNIVTLYKNKGDRSDCNNDRGISLLSIVGKIFRD